MGANQDQVPTSGRIVRYRLSENDVATIAAQRAGGAGSGNPVAEGDDLPAMVVVVWPSTERRINGQVILDGNDSLWITSAPHGLEPGCWRWPERS